MSSTDLPKLRAIIVSNLRPSQTHCILLNALPHLMNVRQALPQHWPAPYAITVCSQGLWLCNIHFQKWFCSHKMKIKRSHWFSYLQLKTYNAKGTLGHSGFYRHQQNPTTIQRRSCQWALETNVYTFTTWRRSTGIQLASINPAHWRGCNSWAQPASD